MCFIEYSFTVVQVSARANRWLAGKIDHKLKLTKCKQIVSCSCTSVRTNGSVFFQTLLPHETIFRTDDCIMLYIYNMFHFVVYNA